MKFLVTTCCKEKRTNDELLPAIERYLDPRIKQILNLSIEQQAGFLILSGKFGLLKQSDLIPYYDYVLTESDLEDMTKRVVEQLKSINVTELVVYGKDKKTNKSWIPYYAVLQKACKVLNIPYFEEVVVTPKIFALVGDFGSGKTTLKREFSKNPKYFTGGDLFGYLHTPEYEIFNTDNEKPTAYKLNNFRDKLLEESHKELIVNDEDILELLAYEFSCIVHGNQNIYLELKELLKQYRVSKPYLFPIGYIYLTCQKDISEKRINYRDINERITPDYFKNYLTQVSYRTFYNEIFKYVTNSKKLQIDTSFLELGEIVEKTEIFINSVLNEDFELINIFDYIDKLNIEQLKVEALKIYDKKEI